MKQWMPRTLWGRTLVILAAPMLLVQLISAYIFFERHWDSMTRRLAEATASEVGTLMYLKANGMDEKTLTHISLDQFTMAMRFEGGQKLTRPNHQRFNVRRLKDSVLKNALKGDVWDIFLIKALQDKLENPFHVRVRNNKIYVDVETPEGLYHFSVASRHVFAGTTRIFMMWSLGTTALFLFIAALFMRNQVRPIRQLADAAEKFGKGQSKVLIKPSGAVEPRKAAIAFMVMRERIARQIRQRTEMLAGVSHDLKTPLTRMRLQLALMPPSAKITALENDVQDMEKMIHAYLAFAKGEEAEEGSESDLCQVLQGLITQHCQQENVVMQLPETCTLTIRPISFRRALLNILQNAQKYGNHIWIRLESSPKAVEIHIEDDGPGISQPLYRDVFRPFFRVEASRNLQSGGTGLGLTIARDSIRQHGGDIYLDASPHGGLMVTIRLPV